MRAFIRSLKAVVGVTEESTRELQKTHEESTRESKNTCEKSTRELKKQIEFLREESKAEREPFSYEFYLVFTYFLTNTPTICTGAFIG